MTSPLKLMCILAHPDDESLGTGGILAKYASEGIATSLITATRGEYGWFGHPDDYPGPTALGAIREKELLQAASALGVQEVHFLDYIDGYLDQADYDEVQARIVPHIRRFKPDVVVTFDPSGAYGHPDHIAICQLTFASLILAADDSYRDTDGQAPHRVQKLYYMMETPELINLYMSIFGDLVMVIDGVERRPIPMPEWMITTEIDTQAHWRTVWNAVQAHRSQLTGYESMLKLPDETQVTLWGKQCFYRVLSFVNSGRTLENDLFAGLR